VTITELLFRNFRNAGSFVRDFVTLAEALSEGFRDFAALTNVFVKPTQGFRDFREAE